MPLAALSRNGSEDLVLFLHGLGCVKENFAKLWKAPELAGAALLAPDLPGHGESQGMPPDAWTMEGMTEAVCGLLRDCGGRAMRLHIVTHSLGGAVGLLLAAQTPVPLASFVNVEANLIAEDCALLSRRSAEMGLALFRDEKFARLKARARASDDPGLQAWAHWAEACPAESFHASARSLVAWSDSGRLLDMYRALSVPTLYVYGERSAIPEVLAAVEGMATYKVANCGHFIMLERPAELAAVLGEVVAHAGG
jgi:pimeloyl-ACP methyl ester carboxylesterase